MSKFINLFNNHNGLIIIGTLSLLICFKELHNKIRRKLSFIITPNII